MLSAASSQLTGQGKASLPLRVLLQHLRLANTVFLLLTASRVQIIYLGGQSHCQIANVLIDNCQILLTDPACEQQLGTRRLELLLST